MKYSVNFYVDEKFHETTIDMEFLRTNKAIFDNGTELHFHGCPNGDGVAHLTFISTNKTELKLTCFNCHRNYRLEWDDSLALQEFVMLNSSFNV